MFWRRLKEHGDRIFLVLLCFENFVFSDLKSFEPETEIHFFRI